ncbi:UNVERIFIED_CONTAM: Multiple myeloma tumor-associated protein 2 [Sesamum radiatum]|uniref:Multiple myeloma tumor-associated protein 2 n=1 Tax=Sesamum radiatum TaxID=300843 RepID=A0AAW2JXC6_SESRA
MYHPTRGGVRGGRDQFTWDDVKVDKHRENYLGHSIKAPVGRWQKVINGARRASPAENGAGLCHGGGKARLLQESGRSPVFCKDEVVAEGGYRGGVRSRRLRRARALVATPIWDFGGGGYCCAKLGF